MKASIETIVVTVLGCIVGWTWHKIYVVPHDNARYEIIECMGDDRSEASYNYCFKLIKKTKEK